MHTQAIDRKSRGDQPPGERLEQSKHVVLAHGSFEKPLFDLFGRGLCRRCCWSERRAPDQRHLRRIAARGGIERVVTHAASVARTCTGGTTPKCRPFKLRGAYTKAR